MSYINPASALTLGILFPTLGSAVVAARFVLRMRRNIRLGWDDWLCIPALLGVIGMGIIYIIGFSKRGVGYHSPPQTFEEYYYDGSERQYTLEHLQYVFNILKPPTIGFIRLSVLAVYHRVFHLPTFRLINYTLVALVIAWSISFTFATMCICAPHISVVWSTLAKQVANCGHFFDLMLSHAISDFLLDLFCFILPMPLLARLHIPLRKKLALLFVFTLGGVAIGTSLARLASAVRFHANPYIKITNLGVPIYDHFGQINISMFWNYLEVGIAMITICLPSFRPLTDSTSSHKNTNTNNSTRRHLRSSAYGYTNGGSSFQQSTLSRTDADDLRKTAHDRVSWASLVGPPPPLPPSASVPPTSGGGSILLSEDRGNMNTNANGDVEANAEKQERDWFDRDLSALGPV